MKLPTIIGTSLGCSTIIAAAAWHYVSGHAADPSFWQRDALAASWVLVGGAGGFAVLSYAVLSFLLLTAGVLHDLDRVRTRLATGSGDPRQLPGTWRDTLAGTDFAALAAHLPGEELTIAPLALLRALRQEIWRIYGTRLLGTQVVTIAVAIVALSAIPYLALPRRCRPEDCGSRGSQRPWPSWS